MVIQEAKFSKGGLPLMRLIREFLEYLEIEKGRALKTIRNYEFYLGRFLEFARLAEPEQITLDLVRKFRLHLNRLGLPAGKDIKSSTQNYHLIALRAFLKYLAKRDIKSLPAENIELAKIPERQIAFLEAGDLERLLEAPLKEIRNPKSEIRNSESNLVQLRDKAILELLFSTGLRVSELVNLKISDINLKRDEFGVRGKGGKTRVVFLSNQAKYYLGKYLEARGEMSPYLFVRHDRADKNYKLTPPNLPLSKGRRGGVSDEPLTTRSVQRLIAKYARAAGITKNVTPHVLRHSYATDLLMNGADIRAVQQILGHSSITTTQIYTHVTDKHLKEVFQAFHAKRRKGG